LKTHEKIIEVSQAALLQEYSCSNIFFYRLTRVGQSVKKPLNNYVSLTDKSAVSNKSNNQAKKMLLIIIITYETIVIIDGKISFVNSVLEHFLACLAAYCLFCYAHLFTD